MPESEALAALANKTRQDVATTAGPLQHSLDPGPSLLQDRRPLLALQTDERLLLRRGNGYRTLPILGQFLLHLRRVQDRIEFFVQALDCRGWDARRCVETEPDRPLVVLEPGLFSGPYVGKQRRAGFPVTIRTRRLPPLSSKSR